MSDKFPNFHLNPPAKALGPNQNKNAQIQLVKL
jgi:hypothetical protein